MTGVDVALLPVSGIYVMTAQEAAEAARRIQPRVAVPMHWGENLGTAEDAREFYKRADVEVRILEKPGTLLGRTRFPHLRRKLNEPCLPPAGARSRLRRGHTHCRRRLGGLRRGNRPGYAMRALHPRACRRTVGTGLGLRLHAEHGPGLQLGPAELPGRQPRRLHAAGGGRLLRHRRLHADGVHQQLEWPHQDVHAHGDRPGDTGPGGVDEHHLREGRRGDQARAPEAQPRTPGRWSAWGVPTGPSCTCTGRSRGGGTPCRSSARPRALAGSPKKSAVPARHGAQRDVEGVLHRRQEAQAQEGLLPDGLEGLPHLQQQRGDRQRRTGGSLIVELVERGASAA